MTTTTPRSIDEYLDQLRAALGRADTAVVQDALYDAEDHLRSELAENPGVPESELLTRMATTYGAPSEVAEIYLDKEYQVQQALRLPPQPQRRTALGRFFAVGADPRSYAALFYMLLALPTGIFYFVWTVVGTSLSLGLMVLIIGLPVATLFIGTLRALSLVEGRLIEVMLGERMPRRLPYSDQALPFLTRVKDMFADPRTWSTLLYMLLKLPLGIVYFVIAVTFTVVPIALMFAPLMHLLWFFGLVQIDITDDRILNLPPLFTDPLLFAAGFFLIFGTLHLARGIGHLQAALAKVLLVKAAA